MSWSDVVLGQGQTRPEDLDPVIGGQSDQRRPVRCPAVGGKVANRTNEVVETRRRVQRQISRGRADDERVRQPPWEQGDVAGTRDVPVVADLYEQLTVQDDERFGGDPVKVGRGGVSAESAALEQRELTVRVGPTQHQPFR
jgi:hypothetical protein